MRRNLLSQLSPGGYVVRKLSAISTHLSHGFLDRSTKVTSINVDPLSHHTTTYFQYTDFTHLQYCGKGSGGHVGLSSCNSQATTLICLTLF